MNKIISQNVELFLHEHHPPVLPDLWYLCVSLPPDQAADPVHPEPRQIRPELRYQRPDPLYKTADSSQWEEWGPQQVCSTHFTGSQTSPSPWVCLQRYLLAYMHLHQPLVLILKPIKSSKYIENLRLNTIPLLCLVIHQWITKYILTGALFHISWLRFQ